MSLSGELHATLRATAIVMAEAVDPWWIITGAAAALHGVRSTEVSDVDVLLSVRDAEQLLHGLALQSRPSLPSSKFRSLVFATWLAAPLPVEFMADFYRLDGSAWIRVQPITRQLVMIDDHKLFVPAKDELTEMLQSFGRPKDLTRARLLGLMTDIGEHG